MDQTRIRTLRMTGLVGTSALVVLAAADLIMLFSPLSDPIAGASSIGTPRLLVGGVGGVLVIPLVLPGLWHIYLAVKPAGRWFAVPTVALGAYAYVLGAAFHYAVMLLVGLGYPLVRASPAAGGQSLAMRLFLPLAASFFAAVFLFAVCLTLTIALRPTHYRRWVSVLTPLPIAAFAQALTAVGPPWLGGILRPAGYNLAMLLFLGLSTALLWHGEREQPAAGVAKSVGRMGNAASERRR